MSIEAGRDFGDRECPSCACRVPANNNRCPVCGYDFPQATPTQQNLKLWGALVMLAVLLALLLGLLR